jgi:hypothetical protein
MEVNMADNKTNVSVSLSLDRKVLNAFLDTCEQEGTDKNRAAEEAFSAWTTRKDRTRRKETA